MCDMLPNLQWKAETSLSNLALGPPSKNHWQGSWQLSALMPLALPARDLVFPLPLMVQQDVVCQVHQLLLGKPFLAWPRLDAE